MELLHNDLTKKIIRAYYNVYNELGHGFLEKVYENAMLVELRRLGLSVVQQQSIKVYYQEELVGNYFADLLIEGKVIVELKAAEGLSEAHEAQLINYLKATEIEVGLLFNFGLEPKVVRKIFENNLK